MACSIPPGCLMLPASASRSPLAAPVPRRRPTVTSRRHRILYGDRCGVQLARRLGISQPMQSAYKTDRRRLPGHVLKRLATVCETKARRLRVDADTLERIADTAAAVAAID